MPTNKTAGTRRYLKPIKCAAPRCGVEFKPKRASQKTCSPECGSRLQVRTKARLRRYKFARRADTAIQHSASSAAVQDQGLTTLPEAAPQSPWVSPVKSEGPAIVARSVTKAKPLSDLERAALNPRKGSVPGLSSEMPMLHTVAAIALLGVTLALLGPALLEHLTGRSPRQ